jgi:hypothetical protein
LIAALVAAGCLAAGLGQPSPALAGAGPPATAVIASAAAGSAVAAGWIDPAWRWLHQLWAGLPWPFAGGAPALSPQPKTGVTGRQGHGKPALPAAGRGRTGRVQGVQDDDEDDDPGPGHDPDG